MAYPINEQQKIFCKRYAQIGSAKKAAVKAGYSPKSASQQSTKLLTLPKIKKQIEKERAKIAKKDNVTVQELNGKYRKAFDVGYAEGQASGMVAATTGMAKLNGLMVERTEQSTDITIEVVRYALENNTKTIEKPKNVIEHTGFDTKTITFEVEESESI